VTVLAERSESEPLAATSVAERVWRIRVPMRTGSVNVYALETAAGPVLIDAGLPWPESAAALSNGLRTIGFGYLDVVAVIATHAHLDHVGQINALRDSGAQVVLHVEEARRIRDRRGRTRSGFNDILVSGGAPPEAYDHRGADSEDLPRSGFEPTERDLLVEDGQRLTFEDLTLEVVHTPGETIGHICLREPTQEILFGGDAVLPKAHIPIDWEHPADNAGLADAMQSLRRLAGLPMHRLMPGHGRPFLDPQSAIAQNLKQFERYLDCVLTALGDRDRTSAWGLTQTLLGDQDLLDLAFNERVFAVGRTLSALSTLQEIGAAVNTGDSWQVE
jgi:glyoxylase-like metal-dependent hydrolase (beta-lactamase superfamily II)